MPADTEGGEIPLPDEASGLAPGRGRLAGRRIVVVGAGTRRSADPAAPLGNGRAISVLAAREGASVACVDIDGRAAGETRDLIAGEGGEAHSIVADVTREADCARLVEESATALGGIDGLVLNVGTGLGRGLAGTSPEDWDRTFALNVRSHFLVCRAATDLLDPGASVVFVSSLAGLRAGSGIPAYDSSKAALDGLCRHVAREGARRRIRANVLAPGLIDTPLGRLATDGRPSRGRTRVPLGRQGTAWEIAYVALFLLSHESSYMTGQTLVADGGLHAL
jgi:NAD(P)-dependent dehydrogenase (short-subunit alcohol dehydrogenase family)